jgi:pyruvate/2-oxoglutarate/acetoin dehydrogenase E1 component
LTAAAPRAEFASARDVEVIEPRTLAPLDKKTIKCSQAAPAMAALLTMGRTMWSARHTNLILRRRDAPSRKMAARKVSSRARP